MSSKRTMALRAEGQHPVEAQYRRRQVFGLLLVAAVILVAALYRAAPHMLFPPGWWRF